MSRFIFFLAACTAFHVGTNAAQGQVSQEAYIKASNSGSSDDFGEVLDLDADTLVIGAKFEDSGSTGVNGIQADDSLLSAGAAYVFLRDAATASWAQQAYLKASNTGFTDRFGWSVAVDGDTVVVGAPFEDSDATGVNGNEAASGAPDSGAAYVFVRDAATGTWSQQAYLKASNTGSQDYFGYDVDIDGHTLVVTALGEDSAATGVNGNGGDDSAADSGAAYVFHRDPSTGAWSQAAYLKASNTDPGDDFGVSVAVSGDTIVVGARMESGASSGVGGNQSTNFMGSSGAAYVFRRDPVSGSWGQEEYLKAPNTDSTDQFGFAVALSGDTAVVCAHTEDSSATGVDGDPFNDAATNSGAAFVYERDASGAWHESSYLKASNTEDGDLFGSSVAIAGNSLIVGAYQEDSAATGVDGSQSDGSASSAGAAYVFTRDSVGGAWSQVAYVKASNTDAFDWFGRGVAISGSRFVVGASSEDSGANGIDGDQLDDSESDVGAAYAFRMDAPIATAFCLGDGTGGACPCANLGGTGEGCANSTGAGALLDAAGTSVVANDDLAFVVSGGVAGQPGLLMQGAAAIATTFRDGILCTGVPTQRLEVLFLDSSGAALSSSSIVTEGNVSPGDTRYYQVWYRDPGGVSPCGTGSNLSQGLVVDWQ